MTHPTLLVGHGFPSRIIPLLAEPCPPVQLSCALGWLIDVCLRLAAVFELYLVLPQLIDGEIFNFICAGRRG